MSDQHAREDTLVQLMAFRVGDEEYVVDIMRVREIIRPVPITSVRRGPKYIEGVINLRGSVIPVVDMRRRFEMPSAELPRRRFMVLTVDGRAVGLIVDEITQVVRVSRSSIRAAPGMLDGRSAPFFLGVCLFESRTLILLNVKHVIASEEAITIPATDELMLGEP